MSRCIVNIIVNRKSILHLAANVLAKPIRERLAPVNIEIVEYQMNRLGLRIAKRQLEDDLGELKSRTIRSDKGMVNSRFGLDGAERIGCPPALVFTVLPYFPPWCCGRARPHIGMQSNRIRIVSRPTLGPACV
jgi:hypothetical protein